MSYQDRKDRCIEDESSIPDGADKEICEFNYKRKLRTEVIIFKSNKTLALIQHWYYFIKSWWKDEHLEIEMKQKHLGLYY